MIAIVLNKIKRVFFSIISKKNGKRAYRPFNSNHYKKTNFLYVNTNEFDWSKNPRLVRDIRYQQFLFQFKEANRISKVLYYLWGITCKWGECFWLWLFWAFVVISFFGFLYSGYPSPAFLPDFIQNLLAYCDPIFVLGGTVQIDAVDPYYLSAIIFTSLGMGGFTPVNIPAKVFTAVEVMFGFIMLGALVAFFANKLVRRD